MSCGCTVWPRCSCDVAPQPTPRPSRVAEYLRHRATIAARWADADALWDAMTESEHDDAVTALGDDWQPRR